MNTTYASLISLLTPAFPSGVPSLYHAIAARSKVLGVKADEARKVVADFQKDQDHALLFTGLIGAEPLQMTCELSFTDGRKRFSVDAGDDRRVEVVSELFFLILNGNIDVPAKAAMPAGTMVRFVSDWENIRALITVKNLPDPGSIVPFANHMFVQKNFHGSFFALANGIYALLNTKAPESRERVLFGIASA